jgi:peptidoglycan/LPS O-acetylase OafA/YrhL
MKRLECLDGLRGALAVYVMLSHMAPFAALPGWLAGLFSHGGAGVDVFFILSGMVIPRSLERVGYRAAPFLMARVFRIFPVFLVVFAAAVAIQPLDAGFSALPWIGPDSPARDIWSGGWPAGWAAEIAAHLTMTHGLFPDALLPYAWVSFLGAAWSLSTEWQFYLLVVLLARRGAAGQTAWALLALAAAALVWAALAPDGWSFTRAFLPNKAHFFALGIASAVLLRGRDWPRFAAVLAATLALCLIDGGIGKLAAPLVWTVCLAAELRPAGLLRPLAALLRARALLWLGAVSYCLYLVNEPVQKLLGLGLAALADGDPALFTALWLPGAVLLPLGAAWCLYRTVEQPALRWGRVLSPDRDTGRSTMPTQCEDTLCKAPETAPGVECSG